MTVVGASGVRQVCTVVLVVLVRCVTAPACCRVQIPTTLVDGRAPLRSRALRAKSLGSNRATSENFH